MSKTDPEIRTVSDLRKALRNGDPTLRFPTMAELKAWETIEKHAGRTTGERATEQTLRRLVILVADHFDLEMYILTCKPLPEFADLCNRALGHRGDVAKGSRPKRGRRVDTDPVRDAKLADAWQVCGGRTYNEGVRLLEKRFPGLTGEQLGLAVDRHRHRARKPTTE